MFCSATTVVLASTLLDAPACGLTIVRVCIIVRLSMYMRVCFLWRHCIICIIVHTLVASLCKGAYNVDSFRTRSVESRVPHSEIHHNEQGSDAEEK